MFGTRGNTTGHLSTAVCTFEGGWGDVDIDVVLQERQHCLHVSQRHLRTPQRGKCLGVDKVPPWGAMRVRRRTMPAKPPLPAPSSMQRLVLSLARDHSPFPACCKGVEYVCIWVTVWSHTCSRYLARTMLASQTVVPRCWELGSCDSRKGMLCGTSCGWIARAVAFLTQILLAQRRWKNAYSIARDAHPCSCLACLPVELLLPH